jgi:hypothetical protein
MLILTMNLAALRLLSILGYAIAMAHTTLKRGECTAILVLIFRHQIVFPAPDQRDP